jgi:tRNA(fMet)-specific endonuclease VapC
VVFGELCFGAEGSERPAEELEQIRSFASTCAQLVCDAETALHYGRIKQRLRRRGRPIPENDLWIAATAVQHQLVLASRDDHFTEVEGLTGERW